MGDAGAETETLLTHDPLLQSEVEPLQVKIDDIVVKNEPSYEDPENVSPLFVSINDIKKEVAEEPGCSKGDLLDEPGCSKWNAPGPSSKVIKEDPDCGPSTSKQIKSEPPDPTVKQEISSEEDCSNSSFADGSSHSAVTMCDVKMEPDDTEIKMEGDIKEEELMLDDENELVFWLQCRQCSYQTKYKEDLKKHLVAHITNDIMIDNAVTWFHCIYCAFKTARKDDIKNHCFTHKTGDVIEYQTKRKDYLKTYVVNYRKNKEVAWFNCPHCNYKTKHQSSINRHLFIHKVEWFHCTSCAFKTRYKLYLNRHLMRHKAVGEINWFRCSHCDFKSRYNKNLKSHLLSHKKEDEINWLHCADCPFKTKQKLNLRRHLISHKEDKELDWFNCPDCSFKTKQKDYLKTHSINCRFKLKRNIIAHKKKQI